ncbi:MAG: Head fiber protein [Clostridia bacterium]|nr:Head fiber protein [Clostridia bacterium]
MSNTARNYHAHGGSEWVIGGKLTFLPGATVEGADTLFGGLPDAELIEYTPTHVPDSTATTVAALREDFNGLLAVLREAGILATSETDQADDAENAQPDEAE